MRYLTVVLAAGSLFLAACQPSEDEKDKEETASHPAIEETQPGEDTGVDQVGGPPDGTEEQAGGGYESAQKPNKAASGDDATTFTSEEFRIAVDYPKSLQKADGDNSTGEQSGTDTQKGWHAFDTEQDGQRLLTLKVPGDVDARFQLGASRSTKALTHCKDLPEGVEQENKQMRTIDDVAFVRFDVNRVDGDNYTTIRSYRATYTESCYAIDMIASGPGGQGEAADRQTEALETLRVVLDGVRFTE